jgi:ferredoxin
MVEDEEEFEYPQIDENKYVCCYQCIKVCPIKTVES